MTRRLSVVHVQGKEAGGGAEIAAYQLHLELRRRGHESTMYVGQKVDVDSLVDELPRSRGPKGVLRTTRYLERKLGLQYLYSPRFRELTKCIPDSADILQLHSLHGVEGYADLGVLPELTRKWTTVLLLHDMWMLTGHCAHAMHCVRWTKSCGRCPDLSIYPSITKDASRANWIRKRLLVAKSRLTVVCPSEWLAKKARQSRIFKGKEIRCIPNAVDTDVFTKSDRTAARKELEIPADKFVALLLAHDLNNSWKGAEDAIMAFNQALDRNSFALVVGRGSKQIAERLSVASVAVPYIEERHELARCYQAADVLVMPSYEEVFGLTAIESMSCGTPVIAYAAGGLPEVLGESEGGVLIPKGDIAELTNAIRQCKTDRNLRNGMASRAVRRATTKFSLGKQVEEFLDLYRELMQAPSRDSSGLRV